MQWVFKESSPVLHKHCTSISHFIIYKGGFHFYINIMFMLTKMSTLKNRQGNFFCIIYLNVKLFCTLINNYLLFSTIIKNRKIQENFKISWFLVRCDRLLRLTSNHCERRTLIIKTWQSAQRRRSVTSYL